MNIKVRVKANARRDAVEKINETSYHVSVNVPPVEGKANEKVVELLAEYFGKPKSRVVIVHGLKSRDKMVEIRQ